MEEMTIWEQYTVTLNKDPKMGFGFALSGGRDKPNPETGDTIVISDVVRNGPAAGRLQIRDQIVMVNGVSMENVTSGFTIQHLKSCGKTANITVKRPRKVQLPASSRPLRAASQSNLLNEERPVSRRPRRASDSGSDHSYGRRGNARSSTPDRNGHSLPLMSGFKRLPNQEENKPIRATLRKKKLTDEYGLKLGSQIFVKHMTATGLAAKEGTLQEGDLILKINGMTTENLSLLETKHLVEKSRGKLTMMVLRDDRKFLVSIPEMEDSAPNSEEDRHGNSSSELEDISDLESVIPSPTRERVSRSETKGRRARRTRAEAAPPSKYHDSPPLRSTLTRPTRRAPSDSESDRSASPPPGRDTPDRKDPMSKYRPLSGLSLPNPRASPISHSLDSAHWAPPRASSAASRPRKEVSESESDRSASPPPRRDSPKMDNQTRYKVLPDLPPPGLRASPLTLQHDLPRRGPSPRRPPPEDDSESDSDGSSGPPRRQGTPASMDSRSRYRGTPEVSQPPPTVEPPRWITPTVRDSPVGRGQSGSESEASYTSAPRQGTPDSRSSKDSRGRHRVLPEMRSSPALLKQASPQRGPSPARTPPEDSSESERAPSPPMRFESTDNDSTHRIPPSVNSTLRSEVSMSSSPVVHATTQEEPLYSLPPDSPTLDTPNLGYSSDLKRVQFVKEGSVGLRLVGGNDVGIFVGGVQPNSPAQQQGMKEGDQIMQVNGVDFGHFTREEAAMFLLSIHRGEPVDIRTQTKMDIYRKILKSNLGDYFYIRTHFDHEAEGPTGLSFTRGEVFRVLDTMHRGKLGNWRAVRMGNDLHELDKGTIPNLARAETMASLEQAHRANGADRQSSGARAEFWKLRGLRGAKKNVRKSRDDLLQLTIQGKYPAYERVLLREAGFKRPIVILGPLNDIAMEKLAREMPDEFEVAGMVPRSSGEGSSTVIKLDAVRQIAERDKHPLLDITPTAVERLNYIQYHPLVLFLDPHSRKDVKTMRKRLSPESNKSSRRLYAQALKIRKHYSHLFAGRIDLQPSSNVWYEILKEKIRHHQSKPVWVSEVMLEGGGEEELDALTRTQSSDYLSCDSRATSDYEDTDGEAYTDGEPYTDNDLDLEESFNDGDRNLTARHAGAALARSSEPASEQDSSMPEFIAEPYPDAESPTQEIPPILHVPEPRTLRHVSSSPPHSVDVPSPHSFSDSPSEFSTVDPAVPASPSDGPPDFRAPDPPTPDTFSEPPPAEALPERPEVVTLNVIEEKLRQTRMAEPQERKPSPQFIVLAHHQAVQERRFQIQGSDSSEDDDDSDDIEWGPATEL
ncbi:hypothetical protein MATL_G00029290 [Megalops atlanticus]|uniref:Tight junction protein ZO-3-like n=1 Tax=Megalops atlanticus TaxID=7932 RepID=A0A9D3TC15_MEGAT|nr:hypothetical protein MATL_G00029290 [Megalops atlanticus]